ncbi:uncharacterized protein LOC143858161 isoform X1 [Tasmannia lanceolata]|uniref:uncharacterized protein LOC143856882 n=1 Tax=Tasmannia lanceolata TaxID=3420 RepID=UPI004063900C
MLRQASSRNQRTRGFKVKHALQICLLVGVCIWLLYQAKHSVEKKAFNAADAKIPDEVERRLEILKLGRKDLNHEVEMVSADDKHGDEEESEREESKREESKVEGREGGDDEIDEHDQEKKAEEEVDHHADSVDEEERENEDNKEKEESKEREKKEENKGDKEKEENDENNEKGEKETNKENDAQNENAGSLENPDHDGDRNPHEAREAQYNGDDASSAVVQDTQAIRSEMGNGILGNSDEKQVQITKKSELGNDNKTNAVEDGSVDHKNEAHKEIDARNEDMGSLENPDHDGGRNSHEAREAQYNGDDASSAVVQDTQAIRSEMGNRVSGTSDGKQVEITEKNEFYNKTNAVKDGSVDQNTSNNPKASELPPASGNVYTVDNPSLNGTTSEEKGTKVSLSKLESDSPSNSTMKESNSQTELHNNATSENTENHASSLQNETNTLDSTQDQIVTAKMEISDQDNSKLQTVALEHTESSNRTAGAEESDQNSVSTLVMNSDGDAAQTETTDPSTSLVSKLVKDAPRDLGSLPITESAVKNTEDVAAE